MFSGQYWKDEPNKLHKNINDSFLTYKSKIFFFLAHHIDMIDIVLNTCDLSEVITAPAKSFLSWYLLHTGVRLVQRNPDHPGGLSVLSGYPAAPGESWHLEADSAPKGRQLCECWWQSRASVLVFVDDTAVLFWCHSVGSGGQQGWDRNPSHTVMNAYRMLMLYSHKHLQM